MGLQGKRQIRETFKERELMSTIKGQESTSEKKAVFKDNLVGGEVKA